MKAFIVFASALMLVACSSVGQKVASGINNSHLKGTVGKPYTQVVYEHPDFGKLIGREKLKSGDEVMKHVGSPRLNAELLLMHAAGCDRTALLTHPERELTAGQAAAYEAWLMERAASAPESIGKNRSWSSRWAVEPSSGNFSSGRSPSLTW